MRTVDGALNNGMIPRPTVVRIDAEGSEEAVLEGAKGLFEMSASEGAPRLVLMIVYPYQLRRVLQWMQARGYQVSCPFVLKTLNKTQGSAVDASKRVTGIISCRSKSWAKVSLDLLASSDSDSVMMKTPGGQLNLLDPYSCTLYPEN